MSVGREAILSSVPVQLFYTRVLLRKGLGGCRQQATVHTNVVRLLLFCLVRAHDVSSWWGAPCVNDSLSLSCLT